MLDGFLYSKAKHHRHVDCNLHEQRSAEGTTSALGSETYCAAELETLSRPLPYSTQVSKIDECTLAFYIEGLHIVGTVRSLAMSRCPMNGSPMLTGDITISDSENLSLRAGRWSRWLEKAQTSPAPSVVRRHDAGRGTRSQVF